MDLSNVAYPWATAVPWARRVGQEFGEQVGASARASARQLLIGGGGGHLGHSISHYISWGAEQRPAIHSFIVLALLALLNHLTVPPPPPPPP
eukprot:COSAG01_NODE_5091_length_4492_cov_3.461311_1_plen_92_part_00